MTDKNQQSLVNGIPQFQPANSMLMQANYTRQSQGNVMPPSTMDYNSFSNQLQKPYTSMVNGQVPQPSVVGTTWQPQPNYAVSSYTTHSGDGTLPQSSITTQQTPAMVLNKSSITHSGSTYSEASQNNHPSSNQVNPSSHPSLSHMMPPNLQSNSQNILKPTPVINRPNIPSAGVFQPSGSGDAPQNQAYEQMAKATPAGLQYSSKPSTGPPRLLSQTQTTKSLNGPHTPVGFISTSSPYNRPAAAATSITTTTNLSNSFSVPPPPISSQEITPQKPNSSQVNYSVTEANPPTIQTPSQTYLQQSSSQHTQHGFYGQVQGQQLPPPPPLTTNQYQTMYKTSATNVSAPSEKQSVNHFSNSVQGIQTYQNQFSGRMVPPPPTSSDVPPPRNVHRLQGTTMSRPMPPGGTNTSKYIGMNTLTQGMERMSVTQQGYNKLWGMETVDLLQCRNILPPQKVTPPPIRLHQEFMDSVNCSPEIFCCTLNKIPESNSLLQKSRLPLGILIHPFRDLSQLAVIQCSSIVRCRTCRTYINPFVYFVDNKRWKCNLCFRVNELPDEFQFDPVSKTYGDPSRRPEIRSSTIEFIAPSEYMLRPPQPAIYLFVLDVSRWGCDCGYLETLCSVLLDELDNIPGDSRTQIGFILFDSTIHFFSIAENYNQAHEMIVTDIDDVFLPTPDSLLVNLNENRQLIRDLLHELPKKYAESFDTDSALGPALQAAYKLMSPTGGRITVFQSCLPNKGPGALNMRDDPNQRAAKDVRNLGPQTDFYKRLSLDCSTQQISVDLFLVSSQYSDLATLGGISQFSGGCIHHFPLFRRVNPESNERLARALRRYLTRKIGFEAVMRVRCSRGLSIHTFHGNFFVRSTDLLSLPNVNPDAGFGMQIAIEDSLVELQCVCFQAAVLYTSAKGERRIRVHTLCLPISSNLSDILTSADQQAIIGLLSKMAVDRSLKSNLSDAREAFINVAIDILSAYKLVETSGGQNTILAPVNLSLIPLYILALLKSTAFRTGQNTRLDDRVFAMSQLKTLPLRELIQLVHPDLYHITHLDDQTGVEFEDKMVAQPARLSLSSEHLDSRGAFLIDTPDVIYLLIGKNVSTEFLITIFDVRDVKQINKDLVELPELGNDASEKLRHFINFLQSEKPWPAIIKIVFEPNSLTPFFINDKAENALSYYELLHHVKAQLK
ncbi:hypothetical protein RUM43_011209 [Polyplax serrata]|uniref:Protein transport protein Sec24A n=1 Tax=Polyplax serrata TaxID=468196 RepID=A0AAN8S039_POLSC